jgi:hypothetical protein
MLYKLYYTKVMNITLCYLKNTRTVYSKRKFLWLLSLAGLSSVNDC